MARYVGSISFLFVRTPEPEAALPLDDFDHIVRAGLYPDVLHNVLSVVGNRSVPGSFVRLVLDSR